MDTQDRRNNLIITLTNQTGPISATALAKMFDVSRQIIVGDIALLRASGYQITATPRGYVLDNENSNNFGYIGIIACNHTTEQLREELYTIVDLGGTVIDVTVEHAIYGQLSGQLNISSRYEADLFIKSTSGKDNKPLSVISGGIHLHKIGCKDQEIFNIIKERLGANNLLA